MRLSRCDELLELSDADILLLAFAVHGKQIYLIPHNHIVYDAIALGRWRQAGQFPSFPPVVNSYLLTVFSRAARTEFESEDRSASSSYNDVIRPAQRESNALTARSGPHTVAACHKWHRAQRSSQNGGQMRHLWTALTTADTFTHDAGAPEWMDVPHGWIDIPTRDAETNVVKVELDPIWYVATSWVVDAADIGRQLFVVVRYFDPGNKMLYAVPMTQPNGEVYFTPELGMDGNIVRISAPWESIWYTEPGRYTFEVLWLGNLATREVGRFSILLRSLNEDEDDE